MRVFKVYTIKPHRREISLRRRKEPSTEVFALVSSESTFHGPTQEYLAAHAVSKATLFGGVSDNGDDFQEDLQDETLFKPVSSGYLGAMIAMRSPFVVAIAKPNWWLWRDSMRSRELLVCRPPAPSEHLWV